MPAYQTKDDKMLCAVLYDEKLMKLGRYAAEDFRSLDAALDSDNHVVQTVARIIRSHNDNATPAAIYKEIVSYLRNIV